MRRIAVLCALLTFTGCETTIVTQQGGRQVIRNINDPPPFDETEAGKLMAVAREENTPRAWWRLGDHYEQLQKYSDAIVAYEYMATASKEQTKETGIAYTAPYYLLGRCHALTRNWQPATVYLKEVLKLQPKEIRKAYMNADFRESHYLLGAIYFEHKMYEDARAHLITFQELSPRTDHRADTMLLTIYDEFNPEGGRTFERDDAPSRPAGAVNPDGGDSLAVDGKSAPPK